MKVEKTNIDAKESKPIDKAGQDKVKNETKKLTAEIPDLLQSTEVPTTASITAGSWVAEMDNTNIRKNTLRIGDR